jgi:glucosyl-3-phosphoglycerate synthase
VPHTAPPHFEGAAYEASAVAASKGRTRISLCLPARDEAATVGPIVERVRAALVDAVPLLDEILVLDDGSRDDTAAVAAAAGATVVRAADVQPEHASGPGKGQALWRSLHAAAGDVVVWCDADLLDFDPRFVVGLVGPLVAHPELVFTKGCYERLTGTPEGGGRVTELTARPALALLHPALVDFQQPLAGEFAGRRAALEQVPFVDGYGVDLALLIDLVAAFGIERVAQVDLGTRRHRNRPLHELGPQALEVLHVALERAGVRDLPVAPQLLASDGTRHRARISQRPPLASLRTERRASA